MKKRSSDLRRRTLLGAGISAVAAAAISCRNIPHGAARKGTWRFFTDHEARTVEDITAQLIPSGPNPGAREAGVVYYIDIQLSRRFRKHQKAYREGLTAVDDTSRKTAGKPFIELNCDQQIDVLHKLEEGAKPFFQLILAHTRQGFYGDPRHGGNRNMVSWKMLGLPFPPVRGREQYEGSKTG